MTRSEKRPEHTLWVMAISGFVNRPTRERQRAETERSKKCHSWACGIRKPITSRQKDRQKQGETARQSREP